MALKIKTVNDGKKLAVVTILGIQGRETPKLKDKATYYFENNTNNKKRVF